MASNIVEFLIKINARANSAVQAAMTVDRNLRIVERTASRVGQRITQAFSMSNLSSAIMSVPGMQFLTNPYVMAGSAVAAIAKVGMEAEAVAVSFDTLLGSQEASKKMLDDIGAMDAKKVYGLNTVQEAAKQMLNFGVNSEEVLLRLRQLGDIAGGDKQKLSALGLVFGQVTAAGKLSGQDLLQFINAGFNPLKELQALTGKSYADLQDAMSKGKISADMVAVAMERATSEGGKFFGMTEKQAQTTGAKLQDLASRILESALKVYEKLQPIINGVIDLFLRITPPVMGVVDSIVGGVVWVITKMKEWKAELLLLSGIILTLVAKSLPMMITRMAILRAAVIVQTAITKLWTAAQWMLNVAMDANPIGVVIGLIGLLASAVVYCWHKFAGFRAFCMTAWDTFKELGNVIKNFVVDRINELTSAIGDVGETLKKLLDLDFEGAWQSAQKAAKKIWGVETFHKTIKNTVDFSQNIGTNWEKNLAAAQADELGLQLPGPSSISSPKLEGSSTDLKALFKGLDSKDKKKKGRKTASDIVTGGKRSTAITMNIHKFFDSINVYMADKADTEEVERIVLQSMNRALAIATSTER